MAQITISQDSNLIIRAIYIFNIYHDIKKLRNPEACEICHLRFFHACLFPMVTYHAENSVTRPHLRMTFDSVVLPCVNCFLCLCHYFLDSFELVGRFLIIHLISDYTPRINSIQAVLLYDIDRKHTSFWRQSV